MGGKKHNHTNKKGRNLNLTYIRSSDLRLANSDGRTPTKFWVLSNLFCLVVCRKNNNKEHENNCPFGRRRLKSKYIHVCDVTCVVWVAAATCEIAECRSRGGGVVKIPFL